MNSEFILLQAAFAAALLVVGLIISEHIVLLDKIFSQLIGVIVIIMALILQGNALYQLSATPAGVALIGHLLSGLVDIIVGAYVMRRQTENTETILIGGAIGLTLWGFAIMVSGFYMSQWILGLPQ